MHPAMPWTRCRRQARGTPARLRYPRDAVNTRCRGAVGVWRPAPAASSRAGQAIVEERAAAAVLDREDPQIGIEGDLAREKGVNLRLGTRGLRYPPAPFGIRPDRSGIAQSGRRRLQEVCGAVE